MTHTGGCQCGAIRYAAANEVPDMPNMVVHLCERLIHFGLQWPEFAESGSWVRKGVEELDLLLDDYFYPDGAYIGPHRRQSTPPRGNCRWGSIRCSIRIRKERVRNLASNLWR